MEVVGTGAPCTAPTRRRTSATSWSRHQRASPANTRAGARGSRKVAVPTSTASAPASIISTASTPARHASDPDDARVGKDTATVVHGAHRHGTDRRSRQTAPSRPRPETVGAPLDVDGHAQHGVDEHKGLGPRLQRGAGDLDDVGHVRAQLHPQRQTARGRRRHGQRGGASRVGEDATAVLDVGTAHVHLHRDHAERARQHRSGLLVLPYRASPDARHHPRPAIVESRELTRQPRRDPRALEPDGVEHPRRCFVHPRCRIAGPGVGGERLHDDSAETWRDRRRRRARPRGRPCPTP